MAAGITLCVGIALVARLLQALEDGTLGHPYLDGLVLAILLGTAVRTAWEPGSRRSFSHAAVSEWGRNGSPLSSIDRCRESP
ncbi:MAG TPA: hypothetical protein VEX11_08380 [Acetobacteraceae bacterium]|nr:hypothetical protein [Acetobacteraceae bacterium]